jgi:ABC-2 type transport system permease protein
MGNRPAGVVVGVAGALLLCLATGWSVSWVFTWVGTVARSAQGVQGISMMFLFPLTFLSNAFVPVDTLPGWLRSSSRSNVPARRHRHPRPQLRCRDDGATWSLLGCAVPVGVFAPWRWQYRRR